MMLNILNIPSLSLIPYAVTTLTFVLEEFYQPLALND
jgi:hypothetical protein